jgi:iron complex transport system substrate-binding protein
MSSKWLCRVLILVLFSMALFASCTKQAPTAAKSAKGKITRIISVAPSNTDIVVGLGSAKNLIGCDRYSQKIQGVPPNLPIIDLFYPDVEALIRLHPDVILANEINSAGSRDTPYAALQKMGLRVVSIPAARSIDEIYKSITQIADVLGVEEAGASLVSSTKTQLDALTKSIEKPAVKPRVFFIIEFAPNIVSLGRESYLNEILERIGAKNIFGDRIGYFSPNEESIITRNPDIILVMSYVGKDAAALIKALPGFSTVNAVRENRIHIIDGDDASRASQSVVKAFAAISAAVYGAQL